LYYSKALELAPQVDDYKRYYHHYLFRKHLSVFNEIRNIGYLFKVTKFTGDCLHNSKALKNRAYIKWEDLLEVRSGEVHLEHISGIKITLKPGAYNTFELSDRIY
jgi:hypothetical protein